MEENTIVYAVLEGYEIKTWIHVPREADDAEMKLIALNKFEEVGAGVMESDLLEFEGF